MYSIILNILIKILKTCQTSDPITNFSRSLESFLASPILGSTTRSMLSLEVLTLELFGYFLMILYFSKTSSNSYFMSLRETSLGCKLTLLSFVFLSLDVWPPKLLYVVFKAFLFLSPFPEVFLFIFYFSLIILP